MFFKYCVLIEIKNYNCKIEQWENYNDRKLNDDGGILLLKLIGNVAIFDFSHIPWESLYPAKWRAKCSRRWHYVSDACNCAGCARLCGKPIVAAYLWKRYMHTHNRKIESNVWSLKRDFERFMYPGTYLSLFLSFFFLFFTFAGYTSDILHPTYIY